MRAGESKREGAKKDNSQREIPPQLSLTISPSCRRSICVGVQQLSLAVSSYRHHAFNVRMHACIYPPKLNLSNATWPCWKNFSSSSSPTLALCRRSAAFAHSPIPSLSSLNSSSTPVLCVSPSHNPPFAPSNYNSIHQSFAVTMATTMMLGTGPRVARGHRSATDHHHLLDQNKLNQSFLHRFNLVCWHTEEVCVWGDFYDTRSACGFVTVSLKVSLKPVLVILFNVAKGQLHLWVLRGMTRQLLGTGEISHCQNVKRASHSLASRADSLTLSSWTAVNNYKWAEFIKCKLEPSVGRPRSFHPLRELVMCVVVHLGALLVCR